jgi:hypothetical protein
MLLHPLNTVFLKWMREARYRWRKRKLAGRTGPPEDVCLVERD